MWTRNSPRLTSTLIAFSLSLIAHGLMVIYLSVQPQPPPAPFVQNVTSSSTVPLLTDRELKKLFKKKRPPRSIKEREPVQEKRDKSHRGQVVEIPPPPLEEIPEKSRFVSEFNSKVQREMVHAHHAIPQAQMRQSEKRSFSGGDDERGSRRGKRGSKRRRRASHKKTDKKTDKKQSQTSPQASKRSKKRSQNTEEMKKHTRPLPKEIKKGEGFFNRSNNSTKTSSKRDQPKSRSSRQMSAGSLAPTHYQSLLPSLGPQDQKRQDGSIDHIKEVERGDRTALNTKEYRYAYFFNRVKREVSERWSAVQELRRYDPQGRVYGVKDRHTVLLVTLYSNGSIAQVKVLRPCGVPLLDRAAVQAFQKAQPFHNPPKGLIESDGLIRFKFGFFLEINSRRFQFLP